MVLSDIVPKSSLEGAIQTLIANLKQQQIYALTGQTEGRSSNSNYGIHFSANKYTIFHGNTYSAVDNSNYVITLDDINITTTFNLGDLIFSKDTGEIVGYSTEHNTITFTQTANNLFKVITIGKYGTIESIN